MESNAHRRCLGVSTLDLAIAPISVAAPAILPCLLVSKGKKRLISAVEARKKVSKKRRTKFFYSHLRIRST